MIFYLICSLLSIIIAFSLFAFKVNLTKIMLFEIDEKKEDFYYFYSSILFNLLFVMIYSFTLISFYSKNLNLSLITEKYLLKLALLLEFKKLFYFLLFNSFYFFNFFLSLFNVYLNFYFLKNAFNFKETLKELEDLTKRKNFNNLYYKF